MTKQMAVKCDNCRKDITNEVEYGCLTIGHPGVVTVNEVGMDERHFCSLECLVKWAQGELDDPDFLINRFHLNAEHYCVARGVHKEA